MSTATTATANEFNRQAAFYQRYMLQHRDEIVGVLLALFLGGVGAHHFYLKRNGLGIFYLCLCWTPLPWVLGFFECFFMPGRVREFNAMQAAGIAALLGIAIPFFDPAMTAMPSTPVPAGATMTPCPHCGGSSIGEAHFCSRCGRRI